MVQIQLYPELIIVFSRSCLTMTQTLWKPIFVLDLTSTQIKRNLTQLNFNSILTQFYLNLNLNLNLTSTSDSDERQPQSQPQLNFN